MDCSAVYADLSILFVVEHVVLDVVPSLLDVSRGKLSKMVRDLEQNQKGNSYKIALLLPFIILFPLVITVFEYFFNFIVEAGTKR